jgi:hypothetical protein
MAEIEIRKRPQTFWTWVVGIGALVLVVISLLVLLRAEDEQAVDPVTGEGAAATAGPRQPPGAGTPSGAAAPGATGDPVAAYRAAVADLTADAAADPERLGPLLQQLAAAVGTVADAAPERAAALRARADSTGLGDWRLPRQALLVSDAFADAAAVITAAAERGIAGVQPGRGRELAAAAGAITVDRPLNAQGAEIAAFLRAAANALPAAPAGGAATPPGG